MVKIGFGPFTASLSVIDTVAGVGVPSVTPIGLLSAMPKVSVPSAHESLMIGMTKLFGGFDQRFYDAYNETYPLEKEWQKRLPITQLYPLLVHAVLFGGHYISQVKHIIPAFHK